MRYDAFHAMAMSLPGAVLDIKWGTERTCCVGGKMFAIAGHLGEDAPRYLFKASNLGFEILVGSGVAEPAPYLARARWVRLLSADSLPDDDLSAYVRQSHTLIAAGLTRKVRKALGIE